MNGSFRVRIRFERVGSGFSGKLISAGSNEAILDEIKSDNIHLHLL